MYLLLLWVGKLTLFFSFDIVKKKLTCIFSVSPYDDDKMRHNMDVQSFFGDSLVLPLLRIIIMMNKKIYASLQITVVKLAIFQIDATFLMWATAYLSYHNSKLHIKEGYYLKYSQSPVVFLRVIEVHPFMCVDKSLEQLSCNLIIRFTMCTIIPCVNFPSMNSL